MPSAERFPIKLVLGITPDIDAAIAAWRRQQPDLPSRSEAIRRLVELGLQASAGTAAPPAKPQPQR